MSSLYEKYYYRIMFYEFSYMFWNYVEVKRKKWNSDSFLRSFVDLELFGLFRYLTEIILKKTFQNRRQCLVWRENLKNLIENH